MQEAGRQKISEEQQLTPHGVIYYTLSRKKVRNLNLRIKEGGLVAVSAPVRMPKKEIDAFICNRAEWIIKNRQLQIEKPPLPPPAHTKEECMKIYTRLSDAVFPLFSDLLGGRKPTIKVRDMRTRWGVCNVQKRTLTFSVRLADRPIEAVEYVVLHEYVHFLHPNHQAGFHAEMARLMPDYKERRRLLQGK